MLEVGGEIQTRGIVRAMISGGWLLRTPSRALPEVSILQFRLPMLALRLLEIIEISSLRMGFAI